MPSFPDPDDRNVLEPGCARCPELADARDRIAWGNGPQDADVMVVGEAPGAGTPAADRWRGGNRTGLAYTTRHSGRRIRTLLEEIGYGDRTYYTNAVKCFPADRAGSNREPTDAELDACRGHLRTEIETIDPAILIPTGKHATATLLAFEGRTIDGFLELVLDPLDLPSLGLPALPILHPSYQNVWIDRLGYDEQTYRREFAAQVSTIVK